jgi:hypothetical protein
MSTITQESKTTTRWSEADIEALLRMRAAKTDWCRIAAELHRSECACRKKMSLLEKNSGEGEKPQPQTFTASAESTQLKAGRWSAEDKNRLQQLLNAGTPTAVAAQTLGRTNKACIAMSAKLRGATAATGDSLEQLRAQLNALKLKIQRIENDQGPKYNILHREFSHGTHKTSSSL